MDKVFLFPGQGSQYVGMGKDLFNEVLFAKEYYLIANKILDFDLAEISFAGPEELLKQTQYTQPAIFTHSVILDRLLKLHGVKPTAVAGHSLGEFSALVSAGILTFEDALRIVNVRCTQMAEASKKQPGSMAAVIGADVEQLIKICDQSGIVVPANFNAPGQVVISGEVDAVKQALKTAKEIGVRKAIPLKVSAAFHSPLMTPAREPLTEIIQQIEFKTVKIPVYQNVSAQPELDSDVIKNNLIKQLENPVRWTEIITSMIKDNSSGFIEVGPGKVLQGLNRRIDRKSKIEGVSTLEEVNRFDS